ncbi:polysaccharide deacetylase family protein [Mariniphaga sediminis]|nr:polysaccharide deacetylase family protein [Mariniphaga sediminis]
MKTFSRFLSKQGSRFFSPEWLFKQETPYFLPFYHVVSDEILPHILNYPYRNTSQFEKELDYYLRYFEPVSLEGLVAGEYSGKKVFHLCFDDGLRECAEVVAPILLRKGIPATFFVNTAFVNNKGLFHKYKASLILNRLLKAPNPDVEAFLKIHNLTNKNILSAGIWQADVLDEAATMLGIDFTTFLAQQQPYLNSEQIKKLAADGFSIGAHSHNHPEFWKIPEEKQIKEVKESMSQVEKLVNQPVRAFAFPFTDWGVPGNVLETIKNEHICDVTFGTAGVKHDIFDFHLQRYPVEQEGNFIQNLKGEFLYSELRKWVGKATVKH